MPPAKKATPARSKASDDPEVTAETTEEDAEETPTEIAQPANPNPPVTVEDSTGTERIVSPGGDGWEPAQVDPTEEQLAAAEEREAAEEEAKATRLTPLEERAAADKDDDKKSKKS